MKQRKSKAQRFEEYHAANPSVYARMVKEARAWKNSGGGQLGIDMLIGRIRWIGQVESWDGEFKINDLCSSFYARLIMRQEPDLDGIFNLRSCDADEWIDGYINRQGKAA